MIVDTNVFIVLERCGDEVDLSAWDPSDDLFISEEFRRVPDLKVVEFTS